MEFIRKFDEAFDLLNSKNPFGKGLKAPISKANIDRLESMKNDMQQYILSIHDLNGNQIIRTRSKTGFLGFYVNLEAALLLAKDILYNERPLKYIIFFKLSQDHLETFFGAVRHRSGNNVNPTTSQFQRAMKGLALHAEIKISNGNCEDSTDPLLKTFQIRGKFLILFIFFNE